MKRLLLIIAICIIIALCAVWGYLLVYGAPESTEDFFANFNFGNTEETAPVVETPPINIFDDTVTTEVVPDALRQLITKPVAGFIEIEQLDTIASSTVIYYIEAGTGHIFKYDVTTMSEERMSNITLPNAKHGAIARDGSFAVIQSGEPGNGELTLVRMIGQSDRATSEIITTDAHAFSITDDNQILYSRVEGGEHTAFTLNPNTTTSQELFTLPFTQATILWGATTDATHYAFPRPASQLEGYLYSIRNGIIRREPLGGFGFSAKQSPALIIANFNRNGEYVSVLLDKETNTQIESPTDFIPEKCLLSKDVSSALCAIPNTSFTSDSLNSWYRGEGTLSDQLVLFSYNNNQISAQNILNLQQVSGVDIDVQIIESFDSSLIYLKNKTDQSLWVFEMQ